MDYYGPSPFFSQVLSDQPSMALLAGSFAAE